MTNWNIDEAYWPGPHGAENIVLHPGIASESVFGVQPAAGEPMFIRTLKPTSIVREYSVPTSTFSRGGVVKPFEEPPFMVTVEGKCDVRWFVQDGMPVDIDDGMGKVERFKIVEATFWRIDTGLAKDPYEVTYKLLLEKV